jgi:hypothetical protein
MYSSLLYNITTILAYLYTCQAGFFHILTFVGALVCKQFTHQRFQVPGTALFFASIVNNSAFYVNWIRKTAATPSRIPLFVNNPVSKPGRSAKKCSHCGSTSHDSYCCPLMSD